MGNASYRQTTGNQYITQDQRSFFPSDLPKFILQSRIGDGKFMKTYIFRVDGTQVVVKVYMKLFEEDLKSSIEQLTFIWRTLTPSQYPNLLPYQMWIRPSSTRFNKAAASPVYLIRQYFKFNLYDRLSTRPFLNEIEKLWIVFQLFKSLEVIHKHGIVHGDIKPENVMCTSFNWMVLTDFAPFKPPTIPDDDPTDFKYYFDCSGHSRCYLAPERFMRSDAKLTPLQGRKANSTSSPPIQSTPLTPAMDVFALGCLVAEVFLDGVPLLDLPGMLKYLHLPLTRLDQEDSPVRALVLRIRNAHVRNVVVDMTQKNPSDRLSIREYLDILTCAVPPDAELDRCTNRSINRPTDGSTESDPTYAVHSGLSGVPLYFDEVLYPLSVQLHWEGVTADNRIAIICKHYGALMLSIAGERDIEGSKVLRVAAQSQQSHYGSRAVLLDADPSANVAPRSEAHASDEDKSIDLELKKLRKRSVALPNGVTSVYTKPLTSISATATAAYDIDVVLKKLEQLINDMQSNCSGNEDVSSLSSVGAGSMRRNPMLSDARTSSSLPRSLSPNNETTTRGVLELRPTREGFVIVVDIVHSNFRHLKNPQSRMLSLILLLRMGRFCSDGLILQRIVPLLLLGLEDTCAHVRAASIRVLGSLLALVASPSLLESNMFPLYIFPSLSRVAKDSELIVRVAFAECMGVFAETAKHFLDAAHFQCLSRAAVDNATPSHGECSSTVMYLEFSYDQKLDLMREQVHRWIKELVVEGSVSGSGGSARTTSGANMTAALGSSSFLLPSSTVDVHRASILRRMLLHDVIRLCVFFGQESTMDKLLTQLLTFLNDPDWELRSGTIAQVPAISAFLGPTVTSECILPFIENAIYDVEERVVLTAVRSLTTLVKMGLLSNFLVIDFAAKCKSLLIHPSECLRLASIDFMAAASRCLGSVDASVFLVPLLRELFTYDIAGLYLDEDVLQCALVSRLSRREYRSALLQQLQSITSAHKQYHSSQRVSSLSSMYAAASEGADPNRDSELLAVERRKLEIMRGYIEFAAREISTKSMQWRSSDAMTGDDFVGSSYTHRGERNHSSSPLDVSVPDHCVQSFSVPHQKYGALIFKPLPENTRKQAIFIEADETKNLSHLRSLFGLQPKQGEVGRSLLGPASPWEQNDVEGSGGAASIVTAASWAAGMKSESINTLKRLIALEIPSLPPDTGNLMQPTGDNRIYSSYVESLDTAGTVDPQARSTWRPKEGVLLTSIREHTDAINRIVICPDQSYFASGSSDGSVKIWSTRHLDRNSFPRSSATYRQHASEILDLTHIENSHSIASASSDGAIHVWRVDMVSSSTGVYPHWDTPSTFDDAQPSSGVGLMPHSSLAVSGLSQIRKIHPSEGAALCVHHFNSDIASVVTYATQRGGLHGWDLRAAREAFHLPVRHELGYTTAMTVAPDRNWICMGSSKGFLTLFDIRYQVPCKLWRHSACAPIFRIASCKTPQAAVNSSVVPHSDGAFLFVAAGQNEAAVWGIPEGGECCKCFRSVQLDSSRGPVASLPTLKDVPIPRHPTAPVHHHFTLPSSPPVPMAADHSVRAVLGRISQTNLSYLITAGTDRSIRFWDFTSSSRCYTISGLESAQPKSIFDSPKLNDGTVGKLFVCYVPSTPSIEKILQSQLPARQGRGVVMPSVNSKGGFLDIKHLEYPLRAIISGSKDGEIKIWR